MSDAWPLEVIPLSPVSGGTVLWRSGGAFRVTVIVKAKLVLRPDEDAVPMAPGALEREDRYRDNDPNASLRRANEIAPYLPGASVILTGNAYAAGEREVTALSARLAIFRGNSLLDKTLHVFGDVAAGSNAPAPFTKLPLVYERAYGGPSVDANPVGVGSPGTSARPNLVDPTDPTRPAGFGPIARSWPSRARWLEALDESAPVLVIPEGFDFRAFSAAPPDQQIPFLEGDEWIVMDNLVAGRPRLQTRLPSVRARARWHLITAAGASEGKEVNLLLDTLSLDAEKQIATLVWRGHFTLDLPNLLKMVRLYAGLELPGRPIEWPDRKVIAPRQGGSGTLDRTSTGVLGQYVGSALPFVDQDSEAPSYRAPEAPRPEDEHRDPLEETTALGAPSLDPLEQTSAISAPFARPALPFGAPPPSYEVIAPPPPSFKAAAPPPAFRLANPAQHAPPPQVAAPPAEGFYEDDPLAHTSAISAEDAAKAMKAALAPFALAAPGSKQQAKTPEIPGAPWNPRAAVPLRAPLEENTLTGFERPPSSALPESAMTELAPAPMPARVEAPPPPPPVAPPPPPAIADALPARAAASTESEARQRARAKLAAGTAFDDADFSGADLSGLDFSGRSLARCKLQSANLTGAHLHGTLLAGAQMSGADLSGAGLEGADLTRADLSQATLKNARFDGAKLIDTKLVGVDAASASFRRVTGHHTGFSKGIFADAVFDDADIAAADFTGASLDRASFRGASLAEVRLNEAQATDAVFDRARLPDVRAKAASLLRCSFDGADASRGQFGKATLTGSIFSNADLRSASFAEAQCETASFAGANLREAHFEDAELNRAKLAAADLEGAKLTRAHGDGAQFDGAKLGGADMRKVRFPGGSFANATLRGARAEEADFTGARFDQADLSSAALRGAKLGGARLTNARLDGTDLRNANLEGANVHGASRATAKLAGANVKDLVETPPEEP